MWSESASAYGFEADAGHGREEVCQRHHPEGALQPDAEEDGAGKDERCQRRECGLLEQLGQVVDRRRVVAVGELAVEERPLEQERRHDGGGAVAAERADDVAERGRRLDGLRVGPGADAPVQAAGQEDRWGTADYPGWTFSSVFHWGEAARGAEAEAEGAEGAEAALAEGRLALDRARVDAAGARADAAALRADLRAALRRLREAHGALPAAAPAAPALLALPPHLLRHALAPQRLGHLLGCRAACRALHAAVQAHFLPVAPPPGLLGTRLELELHGAAVARLYCEYRRWSRASAGRGSSALDAFFALAPWARAGTVPAAWHAEHRYFAQVKEIPLTRGRSPTRPGAR